jgi:hypothetical protein
MVILDNVLNESLLTSIRERVESESLPWYFLENSAYPENRELVKNTPLNYSFYHYVLRPNFTSTSFNKEVLSPLNDITNSISLILKDLFNVERAYSVFRLRWGLTTSVGRPHRHTPHTDLDLAGELFSPTQADIPIPHKVILFYLNESDGDTYFYDKEHNIINSITPRTNRAVLFDGNTLHSSSKPIRFSRRIALNINLVDEEKLKILMKEANEKD